MRGPKLFQELRESKPDHWSEAAVTLAFDLLFGLFPVWGSMLICRLLSFAVPWMEFVRHGEFAIYSAALLGPSLNKIWHARPKTTGKSGRGLLLIAVLGLLVAAVLFSATVASAVALPTHEGLDQRFLAAVSITLFLCSVVFVYLLSVLEAARFSVSIPEHATQAVDVLAEQLKQLEHPNE